MKVAASWEDGVGVVEAAAFPNKPYRLLTHINMLNFLFNIKIKRKQVRLICSITERGPWYKSLKTKLRNNNTILFFKLCMYLPTFVHAKNPH